MPVLKVIEIETQSQESWEDAVEIALQEASKSVDNILSIRIQDFEAIVEDNRIVSYRLNAKIAYEVDSQR